MLSMPARVSPSPGVVPGCHILAVREIIPLVLAGFACVGFAVGRSFSQVAVVAEAIVDTRWATFPGFLTECSMVETFCAVVGGRFRYLH